MSEMGHNSGKDTGLMFFWAWVILELILVVGGSYWAAFYSLISFYFGAASMARVR